MRFNTKKYQEFMEAQNLTQEVICKRTGLYTKSFQWIMANGFASEDAMERLADAAGVKLGDVVLPDFNGTAENAIEFLKDQKRATVTYPDKCEIVAINKFPGEGEVICAHVPTAWIRIQPPAVRDLTEEQKEELPNRLRGNN